MQKKCVKKNKSSHNVPQLVLSLWHIILSSFQIQNNMKNKIKIR